MSGAGAQARGATNTHPKCFNSNCYIIFSDFFQLQLSYFHLAAKSGVIATAVKFKIIFFWQILLCSMKKQLKISSVNEWGQNLKIVNSSIELKKVFALNRTTKAPLLSVLFLSCIFGSGKWWLLVTHFKVQNWKYA